MAKLFDNLVDGSGRRYFSSLEGAPGSISPATAVITLAGRQPLAVQPELVFRTPGTLTITINGLAMASQFALSPTPAALGYLGLAPSTEIRSLIVSPTLPQIDAPEADFVPLLLTQMTVQPAQAALVLQALPHAATEGGNIGFAYPGVAALTLTGLQANYVFDVIEPAALGVIGHAPVLISEIILYPEVGTLTLMDTPPTLTLPFGWIDADPAPPVVWVSSVAGSS